MAANDLRLKVLLDTVDKATAPLRQINQSGQDTARALKQTRERLKELSAQQKDVSAWRQQHTQARETAKALEEARAKVKDMGRAMSQVDAPTKQMTAEFQAAIRATNALKQQTKDEQDALRGLQRRLSDAGIDTRKLNQHNAALRQEMAQTNHTIEQQEARLKQLAVTQRKAAQAKARLERTQDRAGKMAGAGAAGIAGGIGAGMAGAAVLAPQLEVVHQGSMIAAQSGESPARAEQYTNIVRNIRTDGQSTDVAQIGEAVAAAKSTLGALGNVGDKELDIAARRALDLSQIMGIDVAESVQMVGILMKNGLAGSSEQAFDLVAAGLQKVSTQMRGEIPEILHEYSTHFRGMGFSGEEAMSLLVNMAKQGKFALDKTGDAIKEFSIRGSDMSKSSKEAYSSIGLNAQKMSSAIAKGGKDARLALTKTANALLRIKDPAERANAAIALFGTPVEDLAVDQIPDFLKALAGGTSSLGDISGAAEKMGKTFRDNLGGDLDKLTGTWSALIGSLMDGERGPLRELVQTVTEVVGAAKTWITANPELAAGIAKGAAVVAVLVAGMGALTVALASVLGPFALAQYGMSLFALKGAAMLPVVGKLVGVLSGGLMGAIRMVSAALWTLAANPVVLAITAAVAVIAGAAYLIYQNWDQVKTYFASAWAEIKTGFSSGVAGILTVLANFSPIGLIYQAFSAVLNYLGVEMPTRFTEFGGMLISGLVNGLTAGLGLVKDTISSLGESTIGWFKEKLGIHSPSRVFAELGGFTTEGLAMGVAAGAKAPLDAVARMGQDLTQAGQFDLKAAVPQLEAGKSLANHSNALSAQLAQAGTPESTLAGPQGRTDQPSSAEIASLIQRLAMSGRMDINAVAPQATAGHVTAAEILSLSKQLTSTTRPDAPAVAPQVALPPTGTAEILSLSKQLANVTPSAIKVDAPKIPVEQAGTAEILSLSKQLANVTPPAIKVDAPQLPAAQAATAEILSLGKQLTNAAATDAKASAPQVATPQPGTADILSFSKQMASFQRPEIKPLASQLSTGKALATDAAPGITLDTRPPVTAAAPSVTDSHDVISINIHPAPGMNPQAIARAVAAELDRRDREKSARQRSRLSDQE
ncbi:phage tail tape measure protein [Pseudomonas asiatica]|uniref:phage tail tape measure protein n=1 Tax=Pseudomonas asiatica TaxID=2219225 RepID=UPI00236746E0|nr:phage tail tape measure protein [Pseudomonas asiatica]WDM87560.1 phage tail tape measure protein [Pseudomonas asiatica]